MVNKGKVYIAGAGPGNPELMTVKLKEILKIADCVLYDRLANPEILNYCKKDAELIFVGKEAGLHYVTQSQTISLLIEKAKQGKIIVRLKGGDPFIFGRGSEEAIALFEENINFEIIPGITAGIGASAYSGIPLTHRNSVTQCVFITAHESPEKEDSQVQWQLLAKMKNTNLVIYMGGALLQQISEFLIRNCLDENTPAAVIENATLPSQKTVTSNLKNIYQIASVNNFKPPMLCIIGPSVALREKIMWLEQKPLFGKRIVCTRAADQATSLSNMLVNEGALVLPFQVFKTVKSLPKTKISNIFKEKDFDWVIFTSENGVRYFYELLIDEYKDFRILKNAKIAAIGSGTRSKLLEYSINADFVPEFYTSDDLFNALNSLENLKDKNILRIKGDFKNDTLYENLIKTGAEVNCLEVYKILKDIPNQDIINDFLTKGADAVIFTSSSTVNNFFELTGENALELLNKTKMVSIGPVTSATLKQYGDLKIFEPNEHNLAGIVNLLKTMFVE